MLVYCLQLHFLWNGMPLVAGRQPLYSVEVPSIHYARGHEPRETLLSRLEPEPIAYLAGKGAAVQFQEPLSPAAGALEVRVALVPCPDAELARDARLATKPELERWQVALEGVASAAGTRTRLFAPVTGALDPEHPFRASVKLERVTAEKEEFTLQLTSRIDPSVRLPALWSRYPNPGRPRVVFAPPPRPFGSPTLAPRGRDGPGPPPSPSDR